MPRKVKCKFTISPSWGNEFCSRARTTAGAEREARKLARKGYIGGEVSVHRTGERDRLFAIERVSTSRIRKLY